MNNGNKHGAADGYFKELFADHKNSASECNESSLSNCRAQPILSKSLYSLPADDISAGTGTPMVSVPPPFLFPYRSAIIPTTGNNRFRDSKKV